MVALLETYRLLEGGFFFTPPPAWMESCRMLKAEITRDGRHPFLSIVNGRGRISDFDLDESLSLSLSLSIFGMEVTSSREKSTQRTLFLTFDEKLVSRAPHARNIFHSRWPREIPRNFHRLRASIPSPIYLFIYSALEQALRVTTPMAIRYWLGWGIDTKIHDNRISIA